MKIGTRGHYSVIAMVELARETRKGKPVALSKIAEKQRIPLNYLEQLFVELKKAKLVKGIRGAFGGYLMGKAASHINVWEILEGVGEQTRLNHCLCGPEKQSFCMGRTSHCDVHMIWEQTAGRMREFLESITLSDIVKSRDFSESNGLNFHLKHTTSLGDKAPKAHPALETGHVEKEDASKQSRKRIYLSRS